MRSLKSTHISDIMTDVITSKYICVGSPTLNNGILPSVSAFLTYMKGLSPKNRIGMAFGSYGWSGEAGKIINAILANLKLDVLGDGVFVKFTPHEDEYSICHAYGQEIAKKMLEKNKSN